MTRYCLVRVNRTLGASAGSLAACIALLDLPVNIFNKKLAHILHTAQKSPFGPFSTHFDVSVILKVFVDYRYWYLSSLSPYLPCRYLPAVPVCFTGMHSNFDYEI